MNFELFHFIRPYWLYALFLLPLLAWRLVRLTQTDNSWKKICDPSLLQQLYSQQLQIESTMPRAIILVAVTLAIIALAGPTWEQLPQPVYRTDVARVYVLDLSLSMDAQDIKPSRLVRAKQKLTDMLDQSKEGLSALIVYADDAHVVSPLTEDNATIKNMIPTLATDLMPSQGSRVDLALQKSFALLQQAGQRHGEVILLTDGADLSVSESAARQLSQAGHQLHVLAVGTAQGAPIPIGGGGFVKDLNGTIVVPIVDENALTTLAHVGHGRFTRLSLNNDDIESLQNGFNSPENVGAEQTSKRNTDLWDEKGYWLLLLLIPFYLMSFRKGWLISVALLLNLAPVQPGYAAEWSQLWKNDDQNAVEKYNAGNVKEAQKLFRDPQWKASAAYRTGDYKSANEHYAMGNDSNANYNRANALAHLGKLQEAQQAYEQAIKLDPNNEDAKTNLKLIDDYLKKQERKKNEQQKSDQRQNADNNQNEKQDGKDQQSSDANNQKDQNKQDASAGQDNKQDAQQKQQNNDGGEDGLKNLDKKDKKSEELQAAQNSQNKKPEDERKQKTGKPDNGNPEQDESNQQVTKLNQATEQWLRRIPDDPGGLLREKFLRQSKRAQNGSQQSETPW